MLDFALADGLVRCQSLWKRKNFLEYWNIGIKWRNYMILKDKVGSKSF